MLGRPTVIGFTAGFAADGYDPLAFCDRSDRLARRSCLPLSIMFIIASAIIDILDVSVFLSAIITPKYSLPLFGTDKNYFLQISVSNIEVKYES